MLVEFNQLPAHTRFWMFTSNRLLNQEEVIYLNNELSLFIQKWTAHKQELNASFSVIDNAILVVGVDETQTGASGCSIDSMTKEITRLAQQMNIDWLNRFSIVIKSSDGIITTNANNLKDLFLAGKINEQTLVSNALLSNFDELQTNLYLPIKDTWMNRYLAR
jgi:hypothetical protein